MSAPTRRARAWASAVVLALAAASSACARKAPAPADEAPAVDTPLMAFLSEARALHHQADLKEESGDLGAAAGAIERLVAATRPDGARPEVDEVLADAYARLADLETRRGRLDAAASAAERGLGHAREVTYFRGRLLEASGLVEEARARALADAGAADAARASYGRAISLLEEVVRVQNEVIERSLARDGAAPSRQHGVQR